MRLIEAEFLLGILNGHLKLKEDYNEVVKVVSAMPTAYDVDKVVEQLEDYLFENHCVEGDEIIEEIVRKGGVE